MSKKIFTAVVSIIATGALVFAGAAPASAFASKDTGSRSCSSGGAAVQVKGRGIPSNDYLASSYYTSATGWVDRYWYGITVLTTKAQYSGRSSFSSSAALSGGTLVLSETYSFCDY